MSQRQRPTCARPGCERPRGPHRKSFCGADCAALARAALRPSWPSTRRRRPSKAATVDAVVVLRALRGEPVDRPNIRERRTAIAMLTRRGLAADEIARRIGVHPRTVVRYRTALRQETAA